MAAATAPTATDDAKTYLSEIMEELNQLESTEPGSEPVSILTKLSERVEKETEDFHKQDPDPFDDRHPIYIIPNCSFGKFLKVLTKHHSQFLDKVINTYLHSTTNPDDNETSLRSVSARFLLGVMPGLDMTKIFSSNTEAFTLLERWIKTKPEPLCTYATGIYSYLLEHHEICSQRHSESSALVPILLRRLWNLIEPGKYPENEQSETTKCDLQPKQPETTSCNQTDTTSNPVKNSSVKKRKLSATEECSKAKKEKHETKTLHNKNQTENNVGSSIESPLSSPVQKKKKDFISLPLMNEIMDSEVSNSSWVDMMPIVIGCSYSLAPPLSSSVCERYILNFLTPLGEYQDLLSIFLELKALDLVRHYLEKSITNDGLLTFSALRFFASLLCHNKIAAEFVENLGVQRLLSVIRPSMGATGVSICLYYLAYNRDAMDRICQLPSKVLLNLVKYTAWLLECSHESGRCHAALFFSISFQFRIILKLFDQQNALRKLLNVLSTLPIISGDGDINVTDEENQYTYRQAARTTCATLRKYFETHLLIKVKMVKQQLQVQEDTSRHTSQSKVIDCDRENVLEYLDFLLGLEQTYSAIPPSVLVNWHPVQSFMTLDGVKLLLKLIAITCEWSNYNGKAETLRSALDCLAVVTLSTKAQLQLCETINIPDSSTPETGISILLNVAEGESYTGIEPEPQKSALAVIVNCVCGPQYKFEGTVGRVVNTTPQNRSVSKFIDEARRKLWECVKTNNGIKILLHLLTITHPAVHADDLRLLACKALCGLCRCETVKQIASMLPMFNNGQLQALTRQPVMQDRKKQHARFCKYMEELTEQVSGKPSAFRMDLESLRKAHIVSQTVIRYDNRELLQLIHNHLQWSGLHSSAASLAKEALLNTPTTFSPSVLSTPKNLVRHALTGGAGDASTPASRKISFNRGTHAHGSTPALPPHSSVMCTPTQKKMKFRNRLENGQTTEPSGMDIQKYRLSSNGRVTVVEPGLLGADKDSHTPTLNTIVADFLKSQHAHCENPVVTVPEFSLTRSHCCPKPLYRAEAPINIASRYFRRQITPRWGGVGGCARDRQFIYSRFRPSFVFRPPDQENVPYTCCAFMPDDLSLAVGNFQGDITFHSLDTEQDRVIENCANAPIVCLEPSRDGERLLTVAEGVFSNPCTMFNVENMESKFNYRGAYHVEFSKTTQDRVIGTKDSSALIYDAATGQIIQTLEKVNLAKQYTCNKATFSPNDDLVLSDGLLWDPRVSSTEPIHKFDKFNSSMSGIFHPRGTEVIINTEVWDLRNYHLLRTVPYIDQCTLHFNRDSTVMYAAKSLSHLEMEDIDENDDSSPGSTTFLAIDAQNYRPLSVTDTKHKIYDFAADGKDCNLAVIERQQHSDDNNEDERISVCRLYEVGKVRGDDDEEDDFMVEENNDEDDGNDDDDDNSSQSSDDMSSHSGDDQMGRFLRRRRDRRRWRRRRRERQRRSGSSGSESENENGDGSRGSESDDWQDDDVSLSGLSVGSFGQDTSSGGSNGFFDMFE
uniref:DDB1- and CUL4-associated factor 1 isoform X2 n=1 Tax=Ciona intestinalis TaxID=7719 RepID=UPI000180D0DF|nr:DDB1- and CUL4-associated factor 1 isoform X2 [Ciona intestinalis]|eukprot:XP_002123152.1 DDB1- and CUL4-associated factor 1 isoform X2 [Ciona intestinalis]